MGWGLSIMLFAWLYDFQRLIMETREISKCHVSKVLDYEWYF